MFAAASKAPYAKKGVATAVAASSAIFSRLEESSRCDNRILDAHVPHCVLEEVARNPVQPSEFKGAFEAVISRQEFESFRGEAFLLENLKFDVAQMFSDSFITDATARIAAHEEKKMERVVERERSSSTPDRLARESPGGWDDARRKFTCLICLEVLAAPTILPCSHNFCSDCIQQHVAKCVSVDVTVVHQCPHCRAPFESVTFEPMLDEMICQEVGSLTALSEDEQVSKSDWEQRRGLHFSSKAGKKAGRAAKKTVARAGEEGEEQGEERLRDPRWRGLIIAASILMLGLIIACRRKANA